MEMRAFSRAWIGKREVECLVTGLGPVETAMKLTARLARGVENLQGVLHFGVAGAYLYPDGSGATMLDLCLAEEEILGDLGICYQERIEPFVAPELGVHDRFDLDRSLLERAEGILQRKKIAYKTGPFVTVNCVSGTRARGEMLAARFHGLCENMEGAAVARVCAAFALPCLELRCISNFVEDRDTSQWRLKEACRRAGEVAALLVKELGHP